MSTKSLSKAATTVKVAAQTGAAKNESFSAISEDSAYTVLNVLANDPGSARLWSLDQNALKALGTSQLIENLNSTTLSSGASISFNTDGTVNYAAGEQLQSLREGEIFLDSFIYTIRMANGALSTATATVEVIGKNDLASISGDNSGSVQEDGTPLSVSGTLVVSDVDRGEARFGTTSSLQGQYGTFSFDLETGAWTYTLDNDSDVVQALTGADSVQDSLEVTSLDGTAAETVTVTIAGTDEPVVDDDINAGRKYTINKNNITLQGSGLVGAVNDGVAKIEGFTSDDTIHISNALGNYSASAASTAYYDADANLDTLITISYQGNGNQGNTELSIVLLGFEGFTESNWFM